MGPQAQAGPQPTIAGDHDGPPGKRPARPEVDHPILALGAVEVDRGHGGVDQSNPLDAEGPEEPPSQGPADNPSGPPNVKPADHPRRHERERRSKGGAGREEIESSGDPFEPPRTTWQEPFGRLVFPKGSPPSPPPPPPPNPAARPAALRIAANDFAWVATHSSPRRSMGKPSSLCSRRLSSRSMPRAASQSRLGSGTGHQVV